MNHADSKIEDLTVKESGEDQHAFLRVEAEAILPRSEATRLEGPPHFGETEELSGEEPKHERRTRLEFGVCCVDCSASRGAIEDLQYLQDNPGETTPGSIIARSSTIAKLLETLSTLSD